MASTGLSYNRADTENISGAYDESDGGMPLDYDPSFQGPVRLRIAQDVLFLLMFVAFGVGAGVIAMHASDAGDTRRLVAGIDNKGSLCGAMNFKKGAPYYDLRRRPNLYYLNPSNKSSAICVDRCPKLADDIICDYQYEATTLQVKLDVRGTHCFNMYRTRSIFNRCFPTGSGSGQTAIDGILKTQYFERLVGDIYESTDIIFGCCGLAVMASAAMLFLYRYFAFFAVFSSTAGTIIINILLCLHMESTAMNLRRHNAIKLDYRKGVPDRDNDIAELVHDFFYLTLIYTVILIVVLLIKQRKAGVASGIMNVSMSCFKQMTTLWMWPLAVCGVIMIHGIFWLYVAMNLVAAGKVKAGRFEPDEGLRRWEVGTYWGLSLFWGMSFISAFNFVVSCGVVSTWYFSRDKTQISRWAMSRSIKNAMYLLGSLAMSSLIMPVISFYRFWVNLFKKHIDRSGSSPLTRCIWGCWNCCLECFEMGFQYVDKAAYVQMAVYGGAFCESGKTAWQLAARNVSKMQHFQNHANFFLFVSKTMIASLCALACWVWVEGTSKAYVTSPLLPSLFTYVLAYMIASAFLTIVDAVVETTLQCICEDVERNETSPDQAYFMTDDLREYMSRFCQVIAYSKRGQNYGTIRK